MLYLRSSVPLLFPPVLLASAGLLVPACGSSVEAVTGGPSRRACLRTPTGVTPPG